MDINKIRITNFKSIYETLELNFEEVRGFWKISGSVGSGKTTIGEAIIYGLFGSVNGKNNNDLISWGRKHGEIELWCNSKGKSIYIKRELNSYGQSPIYVEVNGEEVIFTNKRNAQSQLEQEYYDTTRVALELLCIISFNNFKSLTTLNTNETKKFLDQILGFYILTEYSDICKQLKSENHNELNKTQNHIYQLQGQIDKLNELLNKSNIEGDIDIVSEEIKDFKEQLKNINEKYEEDYNKYNSKKYELGKQQSSLLTLGKNKAKEISFIEKGICPTCGAPIDQTSLDVKKQEREILLNNYNEVVGKINNINNIIIELKNNHNINTSSIQNEINVRNDLIIKLKEQENRLNLNIHEIDSIKQEIQAKTDELSLYNIEDEQWSQLYDILSTKIRSNILQSFIPSLNKNISKYSQRLHLPYIIQFDHNFKCCLSLYGMDKDIPVTSLSTGQLKTVDMVVILGVLGTIITSNGLNILFLDELFSNLDNNLRNEMCCILKETLNPNSTIFIISHTELDDKYFDGDIRMKLQLVDKFEKHSNISIHKY